jgi:hypothetical protein
MKTEIAPIPVSFAGFETPGKVPSWASGWEARRTTVDEWCMQSPLAGVLVLSASNLKDVTREHVRISTLAERVSKASHPVRVVLNFRKGGHSYDQLFEAMKLFRGATSRLEIADGDKLLERSLTEAIAKYQVEDEERGPDPLAEANEVIAVTETLLSKKGRLDAKAVADALGIPWTRLAVLLGSTKQAVGKTPDSPALQAALRPYERIARLRATLPEKRFLAWMQRSNVHLDDHTPLQIIEEGRAEVVADLVESMLTGTPS